MKYLAIIYGNKELWESFTEEEWVPGVAAQDEFNRRFTETGELLAAYGLTDEPGAKTVRVRDGVVAVTDGPFVEAKEYVGSFYLGAFASAASRTRSQPERIEFLRRAARLGVTERADGVMSVAAPIGGIGPRRTEVNMADRVSRRALLRGGVGAAAGVAVLGGPFRGFVALANGAPRQTPNWRDLRAIPDLRDGDGQVRLWLPEGFEYRSFHDTEFDERARRRHGSARPSRRHGCVPRAERERGAGPQPRDQQPGPGSIRAWDALRLQGGQRYDNRRGDARRAGRPRLHQPQRHADELRRRRDAVGQLDHVRGNGQRARRRT